MRADLLMTLRRQLNKFVYRQFSRLAPYTVACAYGSLAWAGVVLTAGTERISAIWREARDRFGGTGPFLFSHFTVADAMFAPVVFRFMTYEVELGPVEAAYRDHMLALPAMREWAEAGAAEPWIVPVDEVE